MASFANKRGIEIQTTPPHHPSSNPVENFVRPLGKAMKIGHANKISEKEALSSFLVGYRDTPHISTGIAPGAMLFRDECRTVMPTDFLNTRTGFYRC